MDTTTLRPHTFLNYTYGNYSTYNPNITIAIPQVVVTASPGFPTMSVAPDSLIFETLTGYPDPPAKSFTISSDGNAFPWSLSKPSWVSVSASSGVSGVSVDVTPNISGMTQGTFYGDILVSSTSALGSPKKVAVKLTLKPQFPSLDANCDGTFNVSDIVIQLNYMFGAGQAPCNPCTGQLLK